MRTDTAPHGRAAGRSTLRRLLAGAAVLAIAGVGALPGGIANAQTVGTLNLTEGSSTGPLVSGTDSSIVKGTTSTGCTEPGTAAAPVDGYNVFVVGPGVFAKAPPGRPDGLIVDSTIDANFSTTAPIPFSVRSNFKDLATELGGTVVPGDYVLTFRCINQFDGIVYQTFTATLNFSSPTAFTVVGASAATPTPNPNASPTPTPAPNASPTPTPDPNASPTPTPDPNASPTPTPTPDPNASPTPTPTPDPNASPTPTPTPDPNASPTPTPTPDPNASPTPTPDPSATATPTPVPAGSSGTDSGSGKSGTLAYTGAPIDTVVMAGLGLVVLGAGLRHAGRRRGLRG